MKTPEDPTQKLRRKLARKEELIAEYERQVALCSGDDLANRWARKYYQKRMEYFQKEKSEIELRLQAMGNHEIHLS
jgi:hypothetical protein